MTNTVLSFLQYVWPCSLHCLCKCAFLQPASELEALKAWAMPSPHPSTPMVSVSTQMTHICLSPTYISSQSWRFQSTFPLRQVKTTCAQHDPRRTQDPPNSLSVALLQGSLSQRNHPSASHCVGDRKGGYPDASTSKSPSPTSPSPIDFPSLVFPQALHFSLPPYHPARWPLFFSGPLQKPPHWVCPHVFFLFPI